MCDQYERCDGNDCHRGERRPRVKREHCVKAGVDGERAGRRDQHRVCVGRTLDDDFRAKVAVGARTVFDHDRLRKGSAELIGEAERECIGGTPAPADWSR